MNNIRRKEIKKAITILEGIVETVSNLQDEEGEAMDAIAENFGDTDRYARMEESYDCLGNATSSIEEAISYLEECLG